MKELAAFARDWQALFDGYDGYFDHATKDTLINFKNGRGPEKAGAESTDFAGAVRIAPVVYAHYKDQDALVAACRAQTAMTHNQPDVVAGAPDGALVRDTAAMTLDETHAEILAARERQHPGSCAGECPGHRLPDALTRPGHERHAAGQAAVAAHRPKPSS